MKFLTGSWLPKALGTIGAVALLVGQCLPKYKTICDVISGVSATLVSFVVRQDNKSSEQVGAGNTGAQK